MFVPVATNTISATRTATTAYPSGAPEFTPDQSLPQV